MNDKVKEITQDLASAIIRGDTMVPVCNVGPLLEYIEELEMSLAELEKYIEDTRYDNDWEY